MDPSLRELVWRGIEDANPWWSSGRVPAQRTRPFRRHAFATIYSALRESSEGRGVVVLGPRRVGKSVLLHQVAQQLLQSQIAPQEICMLSLDDVALRERDLGELLTMIDARRPLNPGRRRYLLLDEVQHSSEWAGWLKRIADRRDPYVFLATGSSATALLRGGQDAGIGRWREMTLFPWSFREHVELRNLREWTFTVHDRLDAMGDGLSDEALAALSDEVGSPPPDETERIESALIDYLLRGGFPEVAESPDLTESRRRLRQDILDRALGRDVLDVMDVSSALLERMFLRVCLNPGGLWNEAEVSKDLGVSRPTTAKYLQILESAFLVFRLPNLASPVKGQPKVYLVAPSMRQALLALTEAEVRSAEEWGRLAENAVAATALGTRSMAQSIGFWRKNKEECDLVVVSPGAVSEYIEVKRDGDHAVKGLIRAATELGQPGNGWILCRGQQAQRNDPAGPLAKVFRMPVATWLYMQSSAAGGTLRMPLT